MRVLITDVSGAIGRDVARQLLAAGHEVAGVASTAHRYLDPAVDLTVDAAPTRDTWLRLLDGSDAVLHLADRGAGDLAAALADRAARVVLVGEPGGADGLRSAGVPVLVVHPAPLLGRRIDAATLGTLRGISRTTTPWSVLHHDDLTRYLATAAVGEATGEVALHAPGTIARDELARLLHDAGTGLPRRGRAAAPTTGTHAPAEDFAAGWTARECAADAVRGLLGRRIAGEEAREEKGRFALPTEPIPNNLPASDGGVLEPAGPEGLQGEFDTLMDPRFPVQTATNTSEALPGPMTPMTLDLHLGALRIANNGMGRMLALEGVALEQQESLVLGILGHCVYINASVGVNVVENMPGWDEASVRKDAYGNIPDDVVFRPYGGPPMPQGLGARRATLTATSRVIARARRFKEEAERVHAAAKAETLDATAIAGLDDAQLHARALLWRDRLAHGWSVAAIGVMMTGAAAAIHARGKDPEPLGIDVRHLESARTMLAVEHLASLLREQPALVAPARQGDVAALREASPAFGAALDAQLALMGHRGPGECELENASFSDRPAQLVTAAAGAAQRTPEPRTAPRPARTRTGRMAAGAVLARERARDGVVRYTHALRNALREQARRLVERGQLDQVDDVFYLTLDQAFCSREDLRATVQRRRTERTRLAAVTMPDVVVGHWEPAADEQALAVGGSVTGLGVYPGVVEGRVKVLRGPDDDIEPDDILVASVTDVGHTAMFAYAAAVVTDIGGAASHAAIVAREFCVPCVVDTKHATSSFAEGQLVRVDGAAGTITLLEDAPADEPEAAVTA